MLPLTAQVAFLSWMLCSGGPEHSGWGCALSRHVLPVSMSPGIGLPAGSRMMQACFLGKHGECLSKSFVLSKPGTGLSLLAGRLGLDHHRDSLCGGFFRTSRRRLGPLLLNAASSLSLQLHPTRTHSRCAWQSTELGLCSPVFPLPV